MSWIEQEKRVGTAGKRRSLDRVAPKPVWPGLDHNGKPVEESSSLKEAAQDDVKEQSGSKDELDRKESAAQDKGDKDEEIRPAIVPLRIRRRKRKKPTNDLWKEIITEGDCATECLGNDRLVPQGWKGDVDDGLDVKRSKRQNKEPSLTMDDLATRERTPSPTEDHFLPHVTPALVGGDTLEPGGAIGTDVTTENGEVVVGVTPSQRLQQLLDHLPGMVEGISSVEKLVKKLVTADGVSNIGSHPSRLDVLDRQEDVLARMEFLATRQEQSEKATIQTLKQQIQELKGQCIKQEEEIVSLKDSALTRTVSGRSPSRKENEYERKIERMENEARQRNDVILELQRLQEEERKESQNRLTEALQRIEQLEAQNEKLQRRTSKLPVGKDEKIKSRTNNNLLQHPTKSRDSSLSRLTTVITNTTSLTDTTEVAAAEDLARTSTKSRKRRASLDNGLSRSQPSRSNLSQRKPVMDMDSSVSSFGTPTNRGDDVSEDSRSEDSPFSDRSTSSRTRSKHRFGRRIIPGQSLYNNSNNNKTTSWERGEPHKSGAGMRRGLLTKTSLRDLIPNYALDSLARPSST